MRIKVSWSVLIRTMIEILPIAGALVVVSITLNQTQLGLRESDYVIVILIGSLFGFALARTRFHGWAAALYCSLLSLFTALELASNFLPIASAGDFRESVGLIDTMHDQLIFFFDQVLSWWFSYKLGDPIRERTILVFMMGILLWNLTAWWVWWTLRRRQALIGAIPLGLCLAIVVDRSGLTLGYLQGFFIFVFGAHVSDEIISRHRDWFNRKIDYPEGLEVEWSASALVIIGLVIFSARAFPLLATPKGWDTIRDWLQRDEATFTVGGEVSGEPGTSVVSTSSIPAELEVIGNPPPRGEAIVMWVQTSDPPPDGMPGSTAPPTHYWRNRLYTTYTGRGWKPLDVSAYSDESDIVGIPPGRYSLVQTYTLDATNLDALYAVNLPYAIIDSAGERSLGSDGIIAPAVQGPYTYTIKSWAASPTLSQFQAVDSSYPERILKTYLQLPEDLPKRVEDLSTRLTQGLLNNYEKAKRIEIYLRANYAYDLEIPEAPAHQDVVDYFLFEADSGFCSYYASAMVVMLRSIDIPARVVSGYAMGAYDSEKAAYKVVEGNAHAWVEVYFPELGWIEFEPTAGRATFAPSDQVPASNTADELSVATTPSSRQRLFLVMGGIFFLALTVFIGFRILKRSRRGRYEFHEQGVAENIYLEMRNILSWIGFCGHPTQTPHEYLHEIQCELGSDSTILGPLQQLTEFYTRARFGGFRLSEDSERGLQRMWRKNIGAWWYFSLKYRILALRAHLLDRIHRINWQHSIT